MRFNEFKTIILESEGGMARRAEESKRGKPVRFKNDQGQVIEIVDSEIISIIDEDDINLTLSNKINQYLKTQNVSDSHVHILPASPLSGLTTMDKAKAALVMIFLDISTNQRMAWIGLKQNIKTGAYPIFIQTKFFGDVTGFRQASSKKGEENKLTSTQERASMKLKPVDIVSTNTKIPINNVINDLKRTLNTRNDLTEETKNIIVSLVDYAYRGEQVPIAGANQYAKSYEIDLGETVAPLVLAKMNSLVTGNWMQAEESMNFSFKDATAIIFPNDPAEKLYDSYLVFDNFNLKISSKDKAGGAKASVAGLVEGIQKFPERYEFLNEDEDFKNLFEILKIIDKPDMNYTASSKKWKRNGSIAGALQLGVYTGVIDQSESRKIIEIIDAEIQDINKIHQSLRYILDFKKTKDNTRPDYRVGWHLLAAIASEVAKKVNQNPKTDKFFKAILERSNMIQVKTSLTTSSDGAFFSKFDVIYPPVFNGQIVMDSGSNYYATRKPVGKLGFSIS